MGDNPSSRDERRREQQDRFLAAFSRSGVIKDAISDANIPYANHYRWVKYDPEYAARFKEAADAVGQRDILKERRQDAHTPKGFRYTDGPRAERKRASQELFLIAYAQTGVLRDAATASGIRVSNHNYWMSSDDEYAMRFNAFKQQSAAQRKPAAADRLENAIDAVKSHDAYDQVREAQKQTQTHWSQERRDKISHTMTKTWSNPGYRELQQQLQRSSWSDTSLRSHHGTLIGLGSKQFWRSRISDEITFGKRVTPHEYIVIKWLHENKVDYRVYLKIPGRISDIFIPALLLNIEVDGEEHSKTAGAARDRRRDTQLKNAGYRIHRIPHAAIDDGSFVLPLRHALGLEQLP
jgi:hypothetical protein